MRTLNVSLLAIFASLAGVGFSDPYQCEFTAKVLQSIELTPVNEAVTETHPAAQFEIVSLVNGDQTGMCQLMVGQSIWLELDKSSNLDTQRKAWLSLNVSEVDTPHGRKDRVLWKVVKNYLAFGRAGQTWFSDEITMYKPVSQPRCLNCNFVNVVYDGHSSADGHPAVEKIDIESTSEFCTAKVSGLTARTIDSETPNSPTEFSFTFSYSGTESACGNASFLVKAYAKKCMNPSVPACSDFEVRASHSFKGDDFFNLELYRGYSYPNLRTE